MLLPFNTVSHVVVTPTIKLSLLLIYNCNFTTVMNHNVNIVYAGCLICSSRGGRDSQAKNNYSTSCNLKATAIRAELHTAGLEERLATEVTIS